MEAATGCQTIYSENGEILFLGGWDSKNLFLCVNPDDPNYWKGRRVLDIGANTSGLSLELARAGASVVALEPDPYGNTKGRVIELIQKLILTEGLELELHNTGLFDANQYGSFDTVICLGLIYHFRDPQYVLDFLSCVEMEHLIISTQSHASERLALFNRVDNAVVENKDFFKGKRDPFLDREITISGWHPTRSLFVKMMEAAGFVDIVSLTDPSVNFPRKPLPGTTNSAYYIGKRTVAVDPIKSRHVYYPR